MINQLEDISKINCELITNRYIESNKRALNCLWDKIKNNKSILKESIKVIKDETGMKKTLAFPGICDAILRNHNNVDQDIYQRLVDQVYSDKNIARKTVFDGTNSFLLYTLMNQNLVLTEKQKALAIDEALNIIGTKRVEQLFEDYKKQFENNSNILDSRSLLINLDGAEISVSTKKFIKYFCEVFTNISNSQVHSNDAFDMRYYILKNPNFNDTEKKDFIYEFYANDEDWHKALNAWKVNASKIYDEMASDYGFSDDLLPLTDEQIKFITGDDEMIRESIKELHFVKWLEGIRPISKESTYILHNN